MGSLEVKIEGQKMAGWKTRELRGFCDVGETSYRFEL
jgi:hypothetical protein